jgi:hypothetical protein
MRAIVASVKMMMGKEIAPPAYATSGAVLAAANRATQWWSAPGPIARSSWMEKVLLCRPGGEVLRDGRTLLTHCFHCLHGLAEVA